jgi:hypothetical protein
MHAAASSISIGIIESSLEDTTQQQQPTADFWRARRIQEYRAPQCNDVGSGSIVNSGDARVHRTNTLVLGPPNFPYVELCSVFSDL